MRVTLLLFALSVACAAYGERDNAGCRSYYEIRGVRTCLSSKDDVLLETPEMLGSKLEPLHQDTEAPSSQNEPPSAGFPTEDMILEQPPRAFTAHE
ncbi:MAG: hypothetical protein MN733_08735 [Nitrososphaera sp.]|nr:hypothetical protein [Nitrososphaera sp.]